MFTIEQAGSIKKVNTIDELIIEYICTYACKCNSNGVNGVGGTLNEEELKSYINDLLEQNLHFVNDSLKGVATEEYVNQVIKSIDLSEYATLTNLDEYAKLTNLDAYAKKDDIPTDYVKNETLATTLNDYAKLTNLDAYRTKDDLLYEPKTQLPVSYKTIGDEEHSKTACVVPFTDGAHLVGKSDDTNYEIDVIWRTDAVDDHTAASGTLTRIMKITSTKNLEWITMDGNDILTYYVSGALEPEMIKITSATIGEDINLLTTNDIIKANDDYKPLIYKITEFGDRKLDNQPNTNYFILNQPINDGDIIKFTYGENNYECVWESYEKIVDNQYCIAYAKFLDDTNTNNIIYVDNLETAEYLLGMFLPGKIDCSLITNLTITSSTLKIIGKKSDELTLSADAVSNRITDALTDYAKNETIDNYYTKSAADEKFVDKDAIIIDTKEEYPLLSEGYNFLYINHTMYEELIANKPAIRVIMEDKLDCVFKYYDMSGSTTRIYMNEEDQTSGTNKTFISIYSYVPPDVIKICINKYPVAAYESGFKCYIDTPINNPESVIPSFKYLNDEYATKDEIPTDYVNNDTLNNYVNKESVIDGFLKEIELDVNQGGGYSFVLQLYEDANIRQAAIDNGIDIDAYLEKDSSITFKGHFDYVRTEGYDLYFSNGTQEIFVNATVPMSSCCEFYYWDDNCDDGPKRVMFNKISTKILSNEYTDEYANNVPSMKYINNNYYNKAYVDSTLSEYAKLTNLEEYQLKSNTTITHSVCTS